MDIKNGDDIETFVRSLLDDEHGITEESYNYLRQLFHMVPNLDVIWEEVEACDGRFYMSG